jgi:uncharacterized protein
LYLKIHVAGKGKVVAVCDEDLIGKILDDGKVYMDLDRYRSFYTGEKADADKVRKALKDFSSANMVGKESVGVALSLGLVARKDVMYINKTPYIQIYNV